MKRVGFLSISIFIISVLAYSAHDSAASGTITVQLDKSKYTWTDRVNITVTASSLNTNPTKIDVLGNNTMGTITISTRGHTLSPYALVETGPNTGIFTGYVTLTGDPTIKESIGVDGKGKNPTGTLFGLGPTDGLLPSENTDDILVTFTNQNQTIYSGISKIQWNLGKTNWLAPNPSTRILQINDPDMNLNPSAVDSFLTPVFSNSDLAGVEINMTETGPDTGIFRGLVQFTNSTSFGNRLHLTGGNNTIIGDYTDRTLPAPYTPADQVVINSTTYINNGNVNSSGIAVTLDKSVYTWTDNVKIKVDAPALNLDPNKIEVIGNNTLSKITVSTRGNSLYKFKLVETGPNTGIFTGFVTLTGNSNIKDIGGVDGYGQEPTGAGPSIHGTTRLIPAQNIDGISVTVQTPTQTVVGTSPIQWNIGSVTWLKPVYPVDGQGICQIVDPDMNLNQTKADKFLTNVWSETDSGGIQISMNETGKSTGVFQGIVHFTNSSSSGNRLHVNKADYIVCQYQDRTLPSPYTPADQLRLDATGYIAAPMPLDIVNASNPRIVDAFGNNITGSVSNGQQIQIAEDLINTQNRDQPFAYLVQIKDSKGITVSLSWIIATLTGGQTLTPAQSWTPSASGTFTAQIFVLQSIDNPIMLSNPLATKIIVQGGPVSNYDNVPVLLSGTVNPPIQGGAAILEVLDPTNHLIQVARANVASNGTFSTTLKAGGPLFTQTGTYNVRVWYGFVQQNSLSFSCNSISPISCK